MVEPPTSPRPIAGVVRRAVPAWLLMLALVPASGRPAPAAPVSPEGGRPPRALDAMDVEHRRPGHIAVVRPSGKPDEAEGPDVARDGRRHHRRTGLAVGFANHSTGLRDGTIESFARRPGR